MRPGGVLNADTIPRLKCAIVAGGANNQLLDDEQGAELHRRGTLYAPDFVINAGGIINVAAEIGGEYREERAREMTERIIRNDRASAGGVAGGGRASPRRGEPSRRAAHRVGAAPQAGLSRGSVLTFHRDGLGQSFGTG